MNYNIISQLVSNGFSGEELIPLLMKNFPHLGKKIKNMVVGGWGLNEILQFLQKDPEASKVSLKNIKPSTPEEIASLKIYEGKRNPDRSRDEQALQQLQGITKQAIKTGAGLAGTALGSYALGRALPQAAQALIPQVSPTTPIQSSNTPTNVTPVTPSNVPTPPSSPISAINPLPEVLQRQVSALSEAGNSPEQIEDALRSTQSKIVKEYEKNSKTPIKSAIQEFIKPANPAPSTSPMGGGKQEIQQPIEAKVSEPIKTIENAKEDLSEIGGMVKGMMENFYDGIFQSLKEGKNTFLGVKDPLIAKAKPLFDKGLIKSPEDLKKFANNPESLQSIDNDKEEIKGKGSTVALSNGDIGEITNIRQGIATVNSNGKEYRRKLDELIESPINEKDLADLHADLMKGIESKTGQEISRMVNWAGYDPKTNELAFVPHLGALYIYDDISPEDAKELTNILSKRKSTGENFIGAWGQGTKSPIGAEMSKLIKKLQSERGGKGSEYKGKYEKIYDALEPAKIASKQKFEEKQEIKRKEKENGKKRKAKKPGHD